MKMTKSLLKAAAALWAITVSLAVASWALNQPVLAALSVIAALGAFSALLMWAQAVPDDRKTAFIRVLETLREYLANEPPVGINRRHTSTG